MTDKDAFDRLDDGGMEWIYNKCRRYVISWLIKRFKTSPELAEDAYQSAMLIFMKNVQAGIFTEVRRKICSYLAEIARRKWLEETRKSSKTEPLPPALEIPQAPEEPDDEKARLIKKMEKDLDLLGEPCKSILRLFYIEGKSDKQIAEAMNYKNQETVKTMRHKCLDRLRRLFFGK